MASRSKVLEMRSRLSGGVGLNPIMAETDFIDFTEADTEVQGLTKNQLQ